MTTATLQYLTLLPPHLIYLIFFVKAVAGEADEIAEVSRSAVAACDLRVANFELLDARPVMVSLRNHAAEELWVASEACSVKT